MQLGKDDDEAFNGPQVPQKIGSVLFVTPKVGSRLNTAQGQDSSILKDATQNELQVSDMVKSPDLHSKNIEEEAMDRGELQSIP